MTDIHGLSPGEQVRIDGSDAEVIRTTEIGDLPYLRAYIDGEGVKNVCLEDIEIDPRPSELETVSSASTTDLHPERDTVSAEWFDLRSQALQLQIAHEQGQLLSISNSLVRLEPYQLEAVNWVMQKLRQRALIADDVGLGKTIEAGLVLKELTARNRADRVLFVVPAHLQKKWIRDMDRFFGIDLTPADRQWVEGERRRLGEEANIWDQDHQRMVTSMAFLRQDEFQPALEEAFWDVVVVDEAHKAAKRGESPSETSKMVERVAGNSDALLLLSATPHDGKGEAFRSLVEYVDPFLVAEDQDLSKDAVDRVMKRRGKQTIYDEDGERIFPDRDVRTVQVSMTDPKEEEFYRAVTDYVKNVYNRSEKLNEPAVGFAMALMQKRLVSSIGAIQATLSRRLRDLVDEQSTTASLSEEADAYLDGEDLDEDDKEQVEEELAALTVTESDAQLEEEIETLRDLVSLAESISVDSKAQEVRRFLQQLLEEQPDEKVLLFTEYRDTLDYLLELVKDEPWADEILVIHGDVDKEERARIEDEFNHGQSRLLFATDAASEGIDLQHSCHIMVNYELPWNPNRLEQRIGRIHRYGQDKEVKVWNFSFEDTREGEIFEMLQNKVESIRGKLGNTADVLGMLDDVDVDSLIMESIQNEDPPSATKEELEKLIDERQRTLEEWYERSLIDTSTFDQESREKIQEVMDESEDVYGSEADIREFVERGVVALGGDIEKAGTNLYRAELPDPLQQGSDAEYGPFTFSRDFAMDHDGIEYISPDDDVVQRLMAHVLESDRGTVGVKLLPFVDEPGIVYNYRVTFEDGTGEVIREETIPVYVDSQHQDPHQRLGERIVEADTVKGTPDEDRARSLLDQRDEVRSVADQYISQRVTSLRDELHQRRREETQLELDDLEEYAAAERQRIEEFIADYERKAEAGSNMDIAIRGQRERLEKLEQRIEDRREELERKARVISLAPDVENVCLAFPV